MTYLVSEDHTTFIPSARLVQAAKPSTELVSRDICKILGKPLAERCQARSRTNADIYDPGAVSVGARSAVCM